MLMLQVNPLSSNLTYGFKKFRITLPVIERDNVEWMLQSINGIWKQKDAKTEIDGQNGSQIRALTNFMGKVEMDLSF